MSKKPANKKQSKKPWGKYVLIGVLLLVVATPLVYMGYQKYLDKVDADRFASLKADFLKLQTEFNKIDPGWEYEESCTKTGAPFGEGIKSCQVVLRNEKGVNLFGKTATYGNTVNDVLDVQGLPRTYYSDEEKIQVSSMGFKQSGFLSSGSCELRLRDGNANGYILCDYESREIYFSLKQ